MENDKKFIAFCAKEGFPGHAFISMGREDPQKMMTVIDGSWGLYPNESKEGGKSFLIGDVPGSIRDDFLTKNDFTFVLVVTQNEYSQALKIRNEWDIKGRYELIENDCLAFLIEIANIFKNRILVPERKSFDNFPALFLKELINKNK